MAIARKVLGQAALGTTNTTVYTVPTGASAVISSIVVCNRTALPTGVWVAVQTGAAVEDKDWIYVDLEIPGRDTFVATVGLTLHGGARIVARAGAVDRLSISVFGEEVS